MKNPKTVALRPRWWRTARKDWSVRARRKARRGARSRARGSYSDKNEFAEALKSIRNDLKEESIAGDEEERERERERERNLLSFDCLFVFGVQVLTLFLAGLLWVSELLSYEMNEWISLIYFYAISDFRVYIHSFMLWNLLFLLIWRRLFKNVVDLLLLLLWLQFWLFVVA